MMASYQLLMRRQMSYVPSRVANMRASLRKKYGLDEVQNAQFDKAVPLDIPQKDRIVKTVDKSKNSTPHGNSADELSSDLQARKYFNDHIKAKQVKQAVTSYATSFGGIRFDTKSATSSETEIVLSKQSSGESTTGTISVAAPEDDKSETADASNFFDEQYFLSDDRKIEHKHHDNRENQNITDIHSVSRSKEEIMGRNCDKNVVHDTVEPNMFDEQYFPGERTEGASQATDLLTGKEFEQLESNLLAKREPTAVSSVEDIKASMFDEQYFEENSHDDTGQKLLQQKHEIRHNIVDHDRTAKNNNHKNITKDKAPRNSEDAPKEATRSPEDEAQSPVEVARRIKLKLKGKEEHVVTVGDDKLNPRKQKWTGKLDSFGYRILKNQVVNLDYQPEDIVVDIMKRSILFEDDKVIAINKPYGLSSHGGPKIHHSVAKLLPKLCKKVDGSEAGLHLIHRLDKDTTGVLLLAKNEQTAWELHGMFKRREVGKTYVCLTKGIPSPQEGIIDIPMGETTVDGQYRMGLRPVYNEGMKGFARVTHKGETFEAITRYKVLGKNNMCALVECQPESGVKHQIRCHMALGLNTPILGDHKYSHPSRIAPQRLHKETLTSLHIRQPTARYLAMHLHAKALVLPSYSNGRNLFISAPLPSYFKQTLHWLKIRY